MSLFCRSLSRPTALSKASGQSRFTAWMKTHDFQSNVPRKVESFTLRPWRKLSSVFLAGDEFENRDDFKLWKHLQFYDYYNPNAEKGIIVFLQQYFSKSRSILNSTLVEENKLRRMEKHEFECRDLSILRTFWHSRTIGLLKQATKSKSLDRVVFQKEKAMTWEHKSRNKVSD